MISIDSFKIRIPIEQVEILKQEISSTKSLVNNLTGEVEREFKERSYKVERDGIRLKFALESQVNSKQVVKDYLVILINSKLLQERYFEGITSDTIETIYLRLMAEQVVQFSYDTFLAGEVTDVDYKKDVSNEDFGTSIKLMVNYAKEHKQVNKGCNSFNQKTNKGIEFGSRKTATADYPYLKLYHKGLELIYNSNLFYDRYLKDTGVELQNMIRIETTVKNKKHFRKHGIDCTKLNTVINLSQEQLEEIIQSTISKHLNKRKVVITKNRDELTPTEQIFLNTIYQFMDLGLNYLTIRHNLTANMSNEKKAKRRQQNKLDELYESYVKGSSKDSQNEAQESFFQQIGWMS